MHFGFSQIEVRLNCQHLKTATCFSHCKLWMKLCFVNKTTGPDHVIFHKSSLQNLAHPCVLLKLQSSYTMLQQNACYTDSHCTNCVSLLIIYQFIQHIKRRRRKKNTITKVNKRSSQAYKLLTGHYHNSSPVVL